MEERYSDAIHTAEDPGEDLLANLTPQQKEEIRRRVLEGIAEIERGENEYGGCAGWNNSPRTFAAMAASGCLHKESFTNRACSRAMQPC